MLKLLIVGIAGALFLSVVMFMQYGPLNGAAALGLAAVLAVVLYILAMPKIRRNLAANQEAFGRLAEKLGADAKLIQKKPQITGVYRNRQIEIIFMGRHHRKFYCLMSVACGKNRRGLSFRIEPRWSNDSVLDKWAEFNDEAFRAAVLIEERQRVLKAQFGTHDAGVLILEDLRVIYNERDWLVQAEKLDRFIQMLDIACDVADLVERFSETDAGALGFNPSEGVGRARRVASSA